MSDALAELLNHNNPPPDLLVGDSLREKLQDENRDLLKRRDELLAAAQRIPPIDSDDIAGRVSDFVKQLTALNKAAETKRTGAKEPYLEGGRNIDGFFKAITDPVEKIKNIVQISLTKYLRDKADRERHERMEQERLAREAAAKAQREADEQARALANEQQLAAAIEAERAAEVAQADAVKAVQAAEAKPAELSRTRGEYGSVTSLRTEWVFDDLDRATLDLEALRPYLPTDGLEKALRAFIRAGGREIKGARIFETTAAVVR